MWRASGLLVGLLCAISTLAQTNRYMVFFRDKLNTPYSIAQPQSFLSAKAIARRNHSGVSVNAEDLPVNPTYVAQVKASGAKTFFTSKWFNGVLVEATPGLIATIGALPFVRKTELVAPGHKLLGGRKSNKVAPLNASAGADAETQFALAGIVDMQADGFTGKGVMISILDAGFPGINNGQFAFQPVVADGRVLTTKDFIGNSGNVYQYDAHGTEVFSVIGARQGYWRCTANCGPYNYVGAAPEATFNFFVTEDVSSEYRIEEYNWTFAAEKADSAGTDIIQSSLGYNTFDDPSMDYKITQLDGKTAVITRAAGMARDRGIIVVVSAGNEGQSAWRYITSPADADGIIAVGAVNTTGAKAGFSSVGPTADGRIKPDVMAMGVNTQVILPNAQPGTNSGTSLASPIVAGLMAGMLQAFPEHKPGELIEAVKISARQGNKPDNSFGFGIASYTAASNYLKSKSAYTEVLLYPNAVANVFQLSFRDLPEGTIVLSFFDMAGRQLSTKTTTLTWELDPLQIDVSELLPGSYILKVQAGGKNLSLRFMKL
ncbi:MAG TPA: S8 family peptidase [Cyclobacteriaceae bacterium]|nr:S8 family peptidase [Cyclobacteriaceae bacterium]